jgi:hypothetical protein
MVLLWLLRDFLVLLLGVITVVEPTADDLPWTRNRCEQRNRVSVDLCQRSILDARGDL